MSRLSNATRSLPHAALAALAKLGEDLALARKRRKESLKDWAARLQVSVPTLARLEKGDPTVSMGVYATALWMIGRHPALADAAEPREDAVAIESEILEARQRLGRGKSGARHG
ncbi:MAG: XRE family transcriptional regulator [Comamonas sp.]